MFGLGVNRLGATRSLLGDAIANLFSNGEQGVWYDPSAASGSLDWRKNLLEYTESFDNSAWIKSGATVTANDTTAPDGTTTADKIVFDGSSREIYQAFSSISGATASIYAKGTAGQTIKFGVVGNEELFTLTGGWDRLTKSTAGSTARVTLNTYSGATARTIYIWGAQLEEASTASSYQPILSTFENAFKAAFPSHTLYQDSQGETPVTAVGQPVGLMLDKSKGLKQGPELITNGDFAADSDWVKGTGWSISGGVGVANGVTSQNLRQNGVALEENKVYSITFTIVSISQGSVLGRFGGTTTVDSVAFNAAGTYTFFLKANSTNSSFMLRGQGGFTGTVDNVLVKEVLGNHATQPTSTKRPVLARHPEGGIRNLLNYTEQFDNGYWGKGRGTVQANTATAPNGTNTADTFTETTATGSHYIVATLETLPSKTFTVSGYVKAKSRTFAAIGLQQNTSANSYIGSTFIHFNLSTGAYSASSNGGTVPTNVSYSIESVGDGWYKISVTGTLASNAGKVQSFLAPSTGSTNNYQGDGTSGVYMWGAQLEEATEASNYQKRVTDIDVTESGVGEVYYLKFDGADDGMSLTGLTSTSTPITAWFGYSATNANSTDNRLLLDIETGRTFLGASVDVAGNIGYYDGDYSRFAADSDALKVLTYDLVEDNAKIRVDGTQEYSDATYDQRAIGGQIGLFANFLVDANHVAGNLYSCILRAAESTDKEIASTESYVAKKTGVLAQVDGIATLSLDFGGNTYTARNSNGGIL